MRLVEQHTIKPSSVYYNELYDLLHKCKNLYNKGLYVVRQHYFQYKNDNTVKYKYLNYYSLEKKLRAENDVDYRALQSLTKPLLLNRGSMILLFIYVFLIIDSNIHPKVIIIFTL